MANNTLLPFGTYSVAAPYQQYGLTATQVAYTNQHIAYNQQGAYYQSSSGGWVAVPTTATQNGVWTVPFQQYAGVMMEEVTLTTSLSLSREDFTEEEIERALEIIEELEVSYA